MSTARSARYSGPPRYAVPPRWGIFRTPTPWMSDTGLDRRRRLETLASVARLAIIVLWVVTISTGLAAVGEGWRYVLLLLSRNQTLPDIVVTLSDILVVLAGIVSVLSAILAVACAVLWVLRAYEAGLRVVGSSPARSQRDMLLYLLIPGLNVVMAGPILAELEHLAARRPATVHPRPSARILVWWALLALNEIMFTITVFAGFGHGVQAMANAVELHFFTDLCTAGVAVCGLLLIRSITILLEPIDLNKAHRSQVVDITGAPEPALRKTRMPGAVR